MASTPGQGLSRRRFMQLMAMAGAAWALPAGPAKARTRRALVFSDLHWDPYRHPDAARMITGSPWPDWHVILTELGGMELNSYGQETSYGLLESGLDAMAAACPNPEFIVFPGDLPTHQLWRRFAEFSDGGKPALERFIANLVAFVASRIRARFATAPIFFSLGNNDSFCGDYQVNPGGAYLAATAETYLGDYLGRPDQADAFLPGFRALGCYSMAMDRFSSGRVVAINTNLLSHHFQCQCCQKPFDPGQVLDWLEVQLRQAARRGERVWLLPHIPFGVNAYSTAGGVEHGELGPVTTHLAPAYNTRLVDLLKGYAATLAAVINGHTHMDAFKVLCADDGSPLLAAHIAPAMNALFGNNPAFQVLHLDAGGLALADYETHHLDLAETGKGWQREYGFGEAYGAAPDAAGLAGLHQAMAGYGPLWRQYRDWYNAGQTVEPTIADDQFKTYWLAQRRHDADAFRRAWGRAADAGGGRVAAPGELAA